MPPSPISPECARSPCNLTLLLTRRRSIHPSSPTYHYPEYGRMVGPMGMPQQFMPMLPDALMHCYPPSPLPCSMFDSPAWGIPSTYPMSPKQPLHESTEDDYTGHPRYHPHKLQSNHTDPSSPTFYLAQRAISIQNLNAATTSADLKTLLKGAGTVEQCQVMMTSDANKHSHKHGSATMFSADEAHCAVTMFNNMTFMGSRIRVRVNRGFHAGRSGSWDGTMGGQRISTTLDLNELRRCEDVHTPPKPSKKAVDSFQPLVVDGSGLTNKSLGALSTSAPT